MKSFGSPLESFFVYFQNIPDLVYEKAHGPVVGAHYDIHGELTLRAVFHAKPLAQVESHDNLPTQIDEAANLSRYKGHAGHFLIADDLLHLLHRHAKELILEKERAELPCRIH